MQGVFQIMPPKKSLPKIPKRKAFNPKKAVQQKALYTMKIEGRKIAEDQQTLTGEYVIDAHQDCSICNARTSWNRCNQFQDAGKCKI